jgi:hypothetical protein
MTEGSHSPRLSPSAERMRRYRECPKRGLSCVSVQLRQSEMDAPITCSLLQPAEREDGRAIAAALHRYLDRNPIAGRRW